MKSFLFYAALCCSILASCQNITGNSENDSDSTGTAGNSKKISKRDYSINKSNSYSDLFLDSMAMERFIKQKKVSDSIARRMRSFYNTRNYQFAWFASDGLTEQALAFWNLHDYVTTYDVDTSLRDKALQKKMDALTAEDSLSVNGSNPSYINTELTLTQHFIQYVLHNYEKGYVKRKEMERFIPVKKEDVLQEADSLLNKKHKDDKYFENVNEPYKLLKEQLAKYDAIAKGGGWPTITTSKKSLKMGLKDPVIPIIKRRLQITGDMPGGDTTHVFHDSLETAVRNYQTRMGYTPDGKITP
ncbi:MAG TPA: peptidoglycan-binding protein, partial [Flavisolibacter sp.]|nr:peptidoglycan-binding protein [Flavisolibacter sp.]